MSFKKEIENLNELQAELNDPKNIDKQHKKGKLFCRERLNLLLDPASFVEIGALTQTRIDSGKEMSLGDGVITGFGKIGGRQVYVYAQDFSQMGGSLGEAHAKKITDVIRLARQTGSPIIGLIDSGGARIQEGIFSLDGYGSIFKEMIKASGVVPQISVLLGPSAGGASYSPGLSDFVFMVENTSMMFITGPDVVKKVSGEEVSFEELGGASTHSSISGCAHFTYGNEEDCFNGVKRLVSYIPQNNMEDAPRQRSILAEVFEQEENPKLLDVIPDDEKKSYDVKDIIGEVMDNNSFFEVEADFAANAVIGFSRLAGAVVGIVANQPNVLAGVLDIDSSDKISRFVRFCDCFNIPVINFVDTPGYLPGKDQEQKGIIRHGAKVLYAYSEAMVPKISVILRKAFGGAYIAMCSKHLAYDSVLAWPGAQIAVMGPEQAVEIIYRKDLAEAKDPKKLAQQKIALMKESLSPVAAAKAGQVDAVINPKDTRAMLISFLDALHNKREEKILRKHGNIPL